MGLLGEDLLRGRGALYDFFLIEGMPGPPRSGDLGILAFVGEWVLTQTSHRGGPASRRC